MNEAELRPRVGGSRRWKVASRPLCPVRALQAPRLVMRIIARGRLFGKASPRARRPPRAAGRYLPATRAYFIAVSMIAKRPELR